MIFIWHHFRCVKDYLFTEGRHNRVTYPAVYRFRIILSVDPFIDCDYIVIQLLRYMRCSVTLWHTLVLHAAIPYQMEGDYRLIGGPGVASVMMKSLTAGRVVDFLGGIDTFCAAINDQQRYRKCDAHYEL